MDDEHKNRLGLWIKALRSGQYKQGVGLLRSNRNIDGDGPEYFCCLGVACDVFHKETDKGKWRKKQGGGTDAVDFLTEPGEGGYPYHVETVVLPTVVANWFGFHTKNPRLLSEGRWITATEMNDFIGFNFNQIARAIERVIELDEETD